MYFVFFCLRAKVGYDKIPDEEYSVDFITQGAPSEKKMTFCRNHKFFEKHSLPYGYFNGKKIHNKDNVKTKKASDREKAIYIQNQYFGSYGNQTEFHQLKQLKKLEKILKMKKNF